MCCCAVYLQGAEADQAGADCLNGSREATRATFDALPFLKQATSVEIFSVVDSEAADASKALAGGEIAAALARHGVNVTVVTKELAELRASAHIENRFRMKASIFLVMGAYSHNAGGRCCLAVLPAPCWTA